MELGARHIHQERVRVKDELVPVATSEHPEMCRGGSKDGFGPGRRVWARPAVLTGRGHLQASEGSPSLTHPPPPRASSLLGDHRGWRVSRDSGTPPQEPDLNLKPVLQLICTTHV